MISFCLHSSDVGPLIFPASFRQSRCQKRKFAWRCASPMWQSADIAICAARNLQAGGVKLYLFPAWLRPLLPQAFHSCSPGGRPAKRRLLEGGEACACGAGERRVWQALFSCPNAPTAKVRMASRQKVLICSWVNLLVLNRRRERYHGHASALSGGAADSFPSKKARRISSLRVPLCPLWCGLVVAAASGGICRYAQVFHHLSVVVESVGHPKGGDKQPDTGWDSS